MVSSFAVAVNNFFLSHSKYSTSFVSYSFFFFRPAIYQELRWIYLSLVCIMQKKASETAHYSDSNRMKLFETHVK